MRYRSKSCYNSHSLVNQQISDNVNQGLKGGHWSSRQQTSTTKRDEQVL